MSPRIDLTGQRFHRLVVESRAENASNGARRWNVVCSCPAKTRKSVHASSLTSGNTRSCGCLRSEVTRDRSRTHGEGGKSPEYRAWQAMKNRCTNPVGENFADYGGRGITVFGGWQISYEAFLAAVGRRPSSRHSLDRIDNEKGYEPGNVRWATAIEQANNKRSNRLVSWNGRTQTIPSWSRETGIPEWAIRYRLDHGWSVVRALSETIPAVRLTKILDEIEGIGPSSLLLSSLIKEARETVKLIGGRGAARLYGMPERDCE